MKGLTEAYSTYKLNKIFALTSQQESHYLWSSRQTSHSPHYPTFRTLFKSYNQTIANECHSKLYPKLFLAY